jgi:hypothetical protein
MASENSRLYPGFGMHIRLGCLLAAGMGEGDLSRWEY